MSIHQMKVSLHLPGTKFETPTCEMSILFTAFALIPFGRTFETRSTSCITTLGTGKVLVIDLVL